MSLFIVPLHFFDFASSLDPIRPKGALPNACSFLPNLRGDRRFAEDALRHDLARAAGTFFEHESCHRPLSVS
jgi:hypothetical protein